MDSRRRQTPAHATPGPSRFSMAPRSSMAPRATPAASADAMHIPLPTYQPLEHPLSTNGQDALMALAREFPTEKLTKLYQDTMNGISRNGGFAAEEVFRINHNIARRQRRRARDGSAPDEEVENKANSEIDRIDRMTTRMESAMRRAIDGEHGIDSIGRALTEIHGNARTNGASSSQRGRRRRSQPMQTQHTQSSRVTMEPLDNDGDSSMPDARDDGPPSLCTQFESSMQRSTDLYDAQSMPQRYSHHPLYAGFKRNVHEGRNGPEAAPLDHPNRWFRQKGPPEPGVTVLPGAMPAEDDSDDDVVLARAAVSTRCPLTLREFERPLTSTKCPHSFEESAIMSLLAQVQPPPAPRSARPGVPPGWNPSVQCPVPGCDKRLARSDLRADQAVIDSIERMKRLERIRREMTEDDDGDDRVITIGDELGDDDADDVDAVHAGRVGPRSTPAASRAIKKERRRRAMEEIQDDDDDDLEIQY